MVYKLEYKQRIPVPIEKAWEFFSSPANLSRITPSEMRMQITSANGNEKTYAGQIITYRLTPLLGIPSRWTTEITHCEEPSFFVDEQRTGPYALWHHQHRFRSIEGGTEIHDLVHYRLPAGILGRMVHGLLVRKKLENVFAYREKIIREIFGELV